MALSQAELAQKIEEVGPWHYCHSMPHGLVTGTSQPDQLPYKMDGILKGGAFQGNYTYALDAGANSGYISKWLVDEFDCQVDAVEGGEKFFQQLELVIDVKGYTDHIHPYQADLRLWEYPQNKYDLVAFLGTAHHVGEQHLPAVFTKMHKAMKHDGEIVVQTKSDIPIAAMLADAGFRDAKMIANIPDENRSAWIAWADKMKLSFEKQCNECCAQFREERQTAEIVRALGYENDAKFKLNVLEALGDLVLAVHWLRGTFHWLEHTGMVTFPDEQAKRNFFRLYHLIEEYEARVWQVAPPRAILTLLHECKDSGEISADLKWMIENLDVDEHGRVDYDAPGLEDIKDIMNRVQEARRRRKENA